MGVRFTPEQLANTKAGQLTAQNSNKKVVILGSPPSKSNQYKIIKVRGRSMLGKSDKVKKYEEAFFWQLPGELRDKMIDVPFELFLDVYLPSTRNDIDGVLKVILDCLQKSRVIKNDNKCSKIVIEKSVDKNNPRIEFYIKQLLK